MLVQLNFNVREHWIISVPYSFHPFDGILTLKGALFEISEWSFLYELFIITAGDPDFKFQLNLKRQI